MNLSDFYAMPDEERAKVLEAVGYKAFGNQELQAENSRLRKLYYLAANDVIFFGTYDRKTDSWPDCGEFYTPVVNLNDQ